MIEIVILAERFWALDIWMYVFPKLGSNDGLWTETLGIGAFLGQFDAIFPWYALFHKYDKKLGISPTVHGFINI